MNNCPLCKSKVTYVGFASVECSGRGCENFKGSIAADEWVTREWLLGLFARIGLGTQNLWYHKDEELVLVQGGPCRLLKIHGLSNPEIEVFYEGPVVPTVKQVKEWLGANYPQWVPFL